MTTDKYFFESQLVPTTYEFDVYRYCWYMGRDVPGVYMFASMEKDIDWYIYYVGQASRLRKRLRNHERWSEAIANGATTLLVCEVASKVLRDLLEIELIRWWRPDLNKQLNNEFL